MPIYNVQLSTGQTHLHLQPEGEMRVFDGSNICLLEQLRETELNVIDRVAFFVKSIFHLIEGYFCEMTGGDSKKIFFLAEWEWETAWSGSEKIYHLVLQTQTPARSQFPNQASNAAGASDRPAVVFPQTDAGKIALHYATIKQSLYENGAEQFLNEFFKVDLKGIVSNPTVNPSLQVEASHLIDINDCENLLTSAATNLPPQSKRIILLEEPAIKHAIVVTACWSRTPGEITLQFLHMNENILARLDEAVATVEDGNVNVRVDQGLFDYMDGVGLKRGADKFFPLETTIKKSFLLPLTQTV